MKRPRERIYLVPRVSGLVFTVIVLLVFGLGFVQPGPQGLPQILGIALVVAGVAALIQSNENLRGLEIVRCLSVPVPAGEPVVLELIIRNTGIRERVGVTVREGLRWRGKWRGGEKIWIPVLNAGEMCTVRLSLPATGRGRFEVPTLWLDSVMPVGLCFAWKIFSGCGEFFVYPAPRGRPRGGTAVAHGGEVGVVRMSVDIAFMNPVILRHDWTGGSLPAPGSWWCELWRKGAAEPWRFVGRTLIFFQMRKPAWNN
jgi:uncharacterized protein (DUF58 family)